MATMTSSVAETLRVAGYGLSTHARTQMEERDFDAHDVQTVLLYPDTKGRAEWDSTRATYWSDTMGVFTNEKTAVILAVLRKDELTQLMDALRAQAEIRRNEQSVILKAPAADPIPQARPADDRHAVMSRLNRGCDEATMRARRDREEHRLYAPPAPVRRARRPVEPVPMMVQVTHVLSRIHPTLHDEITRQVDGDFARLVVHSFTKVEILPRRG